jgi:RNA polymerase sigma factor (TIGR02999 family)
MPSRSPEAVTKLLNAARSGDADAFGDLLGLVYKELQRLAHVVRKGRAGETLNTTALVHEAYLKLIPSAEMTFHNRVHFFRVAARAMRQVLVSEARSKLAQKRGSRAPNVTFDERLHAALLERPAVLVTLDEALEQLEAMNPRQAQVVECRFFAGMTIEETAYALGLSEPTVNRDWRHARAWLSLRLEGS